MIGRLAVASAVLAASLVGGASAAHAAPNYNPRADVDCTIAVTAHHAGKHVVFRVGAHANSNPQPKGTVAITVVQGGNDVWDKTVNYPGHAVTVVGPVLPRGSYRVRTHFTPDDPGTFMSCRGSLPFRMGVGPDNGHHHGPGGNGTGPLGVLPDTGGPDVLWLLLGTTLVGAGATTMVVARRRRAAALA